MKLTFRNKWYYFKKIPGKKKLYIKCLALRIRAGHLFYTLERAKSLIKVLQNKIVAQLQQPFFAVFIFLELIALVFVHKYFQG